MGLGVADAIRVIRDLMLVAGGTAAAATVLAVYSLSRHRAARIGLTVAAAIMLLTVVSGVFGLLVAAATAMLWSRPARDWFAGRAPAPVPAGASAGPSQSDRRHPLLSSAEEGPQQEAGDGEQPRPVPPPTYGFGTPHAHQGPQAHPDPSEPQGQPGGQSYPGQRDPGQGYPSSGQGYPAARVASPPRRTPSSTPTRRPAGGRRRPTASSRPARSAAVRPR